jgi:pyridoxine 5-phosphate synthase
LYIVIYPYYIHKKDAFMVRLGVNIDHIATIREARKTYEPNPVEAALLCEKAGANGIVFHLREDRRHIKDEDAFKLKENIRSHLNMEMAVHKEIVRIAVELKPDQSTLVPEKREEITTEGGLNLSQDTQKIQDAVCRLKDAGIKVSLFIDPDKTQIELARKIKPDAIEIHTGNYANARDKNQQKFELRRILESAVLGKKLGFQVFAGHGLTYLNTHKVVKIKEIEELNIGHSIISRAVVVGIEEAVREMLTIIKNWSKIERKSGG